MENEVVGERGLRTVYRVDGDPTLHTEDFFGENKGERSEEFLAAAQGKVNYNVTTVIVKE